MKRFNLYLACLAVFALFFTSCSKDEAVQESSEKASLSFGAIVQDLAAKSSAKQADVADLPECTDDIPAYVEIVLMQGGTPVVGTLDDPYQVDLVDGQLFTEEDPLLELDPGNYSLEHFSVYNSDGDLIWLAPKGGMLADWVDSPLPLAISLGAGVKKYVDVSVLCYDDRNVNQYGYLFFELDTYKAFKFCFFANYCTPEGRHYPARYSVDISIDGEPVYTGEMNTVDFYDDGQPYAEPLCLALPDLAEYADDVEYIDYSITLLDWENVYDAAEMAPITGSLSRNEVEANFDGEDNVDYMHVRFGCGDIPGGGDDCAGKGGDTDGDGICDNDDNCPLVANPNQEDSDNDGVGDVCDNCVDNPNADQNDADNDGVGDACDNCIDTSNADQADNDNDGEGNVCDNTPNGDPCGAKGGDTDGDGICNDDDNCPDVYNPGQEDEDLDGFGDACDKCLEYWSEENVDCPTGNGGECDTAYMFGDVELNTLDYPGNNWGWGLVIDDLNDDNGDWEDEYFVDGVLTLPLYAGAGQNDITKGWQAGNIILTIADNTITVDYELFSGVDINDLHIWLSQDGFPDKRAPGRFDIEDDQLTGLDLSQPIYVIVHSGVCRNND